MNNLELKHLAAFLPYNIAYCYTNIDRVSVLTSDVIARREKLRTLDKIKPILRPLSDLTKEIEHNGEKFVPRSKFYGNPIDYHILKNSYEVIEKLLEWHFDIFGLIPAGLAIDINTLK